MLKNALKQSAIYLLIIHNQHRPLCLFRCQKYLTVFLQFLIHHPLFRNIGKRTDDNVLFAHARDVFQLQMYPDRASAL